MKKIVKISIISGCNFGAVLGVVVALMLDFITGNALGGGWYESVQHDVGMMFGPVWADKQWFIYSGIVVVIALIASIGAIIGAFFGAIVGTVFSGLVK